jgi:hypothetical protein
MTISSETYVYDLQGEVWEKLVINDPRDLDANGDPLRRVTGKIVDHQTKLPIAAKLNFFVRNLLWSPTYVGSTETNEFGRFTFRFSDQSRCVNEIISLDVGVVAKKSLYPDKGLNSLYEEKALGIIRLTSRKMHEDLGQLALEPITEQSKETGLFKPVKQRDSVSSRIWKSIKCCPKWMYSKINQEKLSKESIHQLFHNQIEGCFKEGPLISRFIWSLLNIYDFQQFKVVDNETLSWNIGLTDEILENMSLPSVDIVARVVDGKKISLKYIQVQYLQDEAAYQVPASSKEINKAIYIAESLLGLKGELEVTLGAKKKLIGIIASQFKECISKDNPLCKLMQPFFIGYSNPPCDGYEGVVEGEHDLLKLSCLTTQERSALVVKGLLAEVPLLYQQPTEPVFKDHVGTLRSEYYQLVKEYVSRYIGHYQTTISSTMWSQIYELSKALERECTQFVPITCHPMDSENDDEEKLASLLTWCIVSSTWDQWMAKLRSSILSDPKRVSLSFKTVAFGEGAQFDGFGDGTKEEMMRQMYTSTFYDGQLTSGLLAEVVKGLKRIIKQYAKKFNEFFDI